MTSKKIAIIGSGISGLTVGWLLNSNPNYSVHLFDKAPNTGLIVHTYTFPAAHPKLKNEKPITIDIPFRVHSPPYYLNLVALLKALGVETSDYYQDIALFNSKGENIISYQNIKIGPFTFPWVNLKSWSYCWEFIKFKWIAERDLKSGSLEGLTVEQYLKKRTFSRAFINDFLYNYLSLVCTCSYDTLRQYPAIPIVHFICEISSGVSLRQFKYGTTDVAQRLEKDLKKTYGLATQCIRLHGEKVIVCHENGCEEEFDSVIIATEPTVAYQLIKDVPELYQQAMILKQFRIEKSSISVHSDTSVLPLGINSPKNSMISRENTSDVHNQIYTSMQGDDVKLIQSWSMKCPARPETIYREVIIE